MRYQRILAVLISLQLAVLMPSAAAAAAETETASVTEWTETALPTESTISETTEAAFADATEPITESAEMTETVYDAASFVARLYIEILGREADEGGLANWTTRLESGEKTAAEVALGLISSGEYQNRQTTDEAYITMLYRSLQNTEPDEAALAAWCENAKLFSRNYLLRCFVQSDAFAALCADYGVTQGDIALTENRDLHTGLTTFLAGLHLQCTGTAASVDVLNSCTGEVLQGERTLTELCHSYILSSSDGAKGAPDKAYAALMYRALLGREPDLSGLTSWTNALSKGDSRFYVFLRFMKSGEFTGLAENYGISAYLSDLEGSAATVKAGGTYDVYQSPSADAASLGDVYSGQILSVTGIRGDWYEVYFHNQSGYIQRSLVSAYEGTGIRVLPVSNIPQSSDIGGTPLPTGCEVSSLSVLLQYLGYTDASKNLLADTYMPKGSIGSTDPNYAFIGVPESSSSYGAYAGVMIRTFDNYISDMGYTEHKITDISGSDMEALYRQIDLGRPVLVWCTMNCTATRAYGATWTLQRGTEWTAPGTGSYSFTWKKNEHCSVLVGYNKEKNTVILADVWANSGAPSGGLTEYDADKFESAYTWLGQQALIITDSSIPVTGDVNCDGTLSVLDAVLLQKYLLGLAELTAEQAERTDLTLDRKLDVYDLALLKRKLFS